MNDVTVVVATYNRPVMLEVGLHSILASAAVVKAQGISTRILVVDDCSSDLAAQSVAKRLGVDYLRHKENGGVAQTLATGVEATDSTYFSLWGDDDFMLPRYLQLHLSKIAEGWDVVAGSYWKADANLRLQRPVMLQPASFADLRQGRVGCNDGAMVRRESLGDISFRPERERAMMMTFWLAMAVAGKRFTAIAEPTWLYRRHDGNLSNKRTAHDNELRQAAIADYA